MVRLDIVRNFYYRLFHRRFQSPNSLITASLPKDKVAYLLKDADTYARSPGSNRGITRLHDLMFLLP
jgi:hypothetical protein